MLTVACVKWGNIYGPEYVNKLRAMVKRNLTMSHRFICFTENSADLDREILSAPLFHDLEGWWGKLALFEPGFLRGDRVLFLDLDTIILGSLDKIAAYDGQFAILRDFVFPEHYGSGVMAWTPSPLTESIWTSWNKANRPRPKRGDQAWIEKTFKESDFVPDLWQDLFPGEFVSYKVNCFYMPPLPDAKVVCFHGTPKPHECKRKFVTDNWTSRIKEVA